MDTMGLHELNIVMGVYATFSYYCSVGWNIFFQVNAALKINRERHLKHGFHEVDIHQ